MGIVSVAIEPRLSTTFYQLPDNTRPIASTKASAPKAISSSEVFSVQWRLMPPIDGTNIIAAGINGAITWASWLAPDEN